MVKIIELDPFETLYLPDCGRINFFPFKSEGLLSLCWRRPTSVAYWMGAKQKCLTLRGYHSIQQPINNYGRTE